MEFLIISCKIRGNIWIATKGDGIILAEKEGHILSLLDSNMMKMIFIA